MIEFVVQVVKHTPIWVWGIFVALLVLGVRQMRARVVKPYVVLIAPVVFFVLGLVSSGRSPLAFAAWAVAIVLVASVVFFVLRPVGAASFDSSSGRLNVPGSAWPLFFMLALFALNYVINVAQAINPALLTEAAWRLGTPALLGALSGAFVGRSVSLFALSRGGIRRAKLA